MFRASPGPMHYSKPQTWAEVGMDRVLGAAREAWPCLGTMVVLTTDIPGTKGMDLAFGHLLWWPDVE